MAGRRAWLLGALALLSALGLPSCGVGANSVLARDFPREVTVYVAVSERVAKTDSGNVAAMVDALEADLRENGRFVNIVGARPGEKPPVPRVELQVWDSDSGDAGLRGAGQMMMSPVGTALVAGGSGSMVVHAYVVNAKGASYLGRFSHGSFGAVTEVEIAAGERTGHAIASKLAR